MHGVVPARWSPLPLKYRPTTMQAAPEPHLDVTKHTLARPCGVGEDLRSAAAVQGGEQLSHECKQTAASACQAALSYAAASSTLALNSRSGSAGTMPATVTAAKQEPPGAAVATSGCSMAAAVLPDRWLEPWSRCSR